MDLYHGECKEARLKTKPIEANIAIIGSYEDWCKVIKRTSSDNGPAFR